MSKGTIASIVVIVFLAAMVGFNLFVADGSEDNPVVTSIREEEGADPAEEPVATVTTKAEAEESDAPRGIFEEYSNATLASARERGDKTILFFHAAWCVTCKGLARNLEAGIVPDGLTVLQLDYDSETELKQKYGVTFQHTLVQIDEDGNELTKWAQSRDINEILSEVI